MNLEQVISKYKENNRRDFKLKSAVDLFIIHDIDFTMIKGFATLSEENRIIFEQMIVNFYNAQGIELRTAMVPRGIYCIEEKIWWDTDRSKAGMKLSIQSTYKVLGSDEKELCKINEKYYDNLNKMLSHATVETIHYLCYEYDRYGSKDRVYFNGPFGWW